MLRALDHPREQAGAETGEEAEQGRAQEIHERERRRAVHREERLGAVDRDQREVAARGRDQRGEQHATREIFLKRHLDREDRAGRGRLEDRGDARGRARDEQQVRIGADQKRSPTPLQRGADRRAHVDRRAFETHRAATAERCDGRNHSVQHVADAQPLPAVERNDVFVSRVP